MNYLCCLHALNSLAVYGCVTRDNHCLAKSTTAPSCFFCGPFSSFRMSDQLLPYDASTDQAELLDSSRLFAQSHGMLMQRFSDNGGSGATTTPQALVMPHTLQPCPVPHDAYRYMT